MTNLTPMSSSRRVRVPRKSLIALAAASGLTLFATFAGAQDWVENSTGTINWSAGGGLAWAGGVTSVSSNTTAIGFFSTNPTPVAGTIVANQDIAIPLTLNSLSMNGTGPDSGYSVLTLQGGGLVFQGTTPQLNLNPTYGSSGGCTVKVIKTSL